MCLFQEKQKAVDLNLTGEQCGSCLQVLLCIYLFIFLKLFYLHRQTLNFEPSRCVCAGEEARCEVRSHGGSML